MTTVFRSPVLLLATTVLMSSPLGARAASIDLNQLSLIRSRPIASSTALSFFGAVENNQGQTVFLNPDPSAPDRGHLEISKNANRFIAPYYAAGRNASPEQIGATRAASFTGASGFTGLLNYLTVNNIASDELGFGYGQKSDRDFRETWNLGEDKFGQDWFGSPDSTIGERIYRANPSAVESFLALGNTKIVTFSYSPLYVAFDFGPTPGFDDTIDLFFSDPVTVSKVAGLSPLADGLADALLADVNRAGNRVQLVVEDFGAPDSTPTFANGLIVANVRLPLSIRVVQVNEPSLEYGLLVFGALGFVVRPFLQKLTGAKLPAENSEN
jgi:hypothetical protein